MMIVCKYRRSVHRTGLRLCSLALASVLIGGGGAAVAKEACFPKLHALIDSEVKSGIYPGAAMIVDRGGEIILDTRRGTLAPDRDIAMPADAIFRIYSMTKPITSVAIMMLVERGQIDLQAWLGGQES